MSDMSPWDTIVGMAASIGVSVLTVTALFGILEAIDHTSARSWFGLLVLLMVIVYGSLHAVAAIAARRLHHPGLAIGAITMGSIGLLFIGGCGFLLAAFLDF
jgi:choline-glycine betaine transporter